VVAREEESCTSLELDAVYDLLAHAADGKANSSIVSERIDYRKGSFQSVERPTETFVSTFSVRIAPRCHPFLAP
jgi:hypothetical protein